MECLNDCAADLMGQHSCTLHRFESSLSCRTNALRIDRGHCARNTLTRPKALARTPSFPNAHLTSCVLTLPPLLLRGGTIAEGSVRLLKTFFHTQFTCRGRGAAACMFSLGYTILHVFLRCYIIK